MSYLGDRGLKTLIALVQDGVIKSASFDNIYGTDLEDKFYFGQVLPFEFKDGWSIKYRITVRNVGDDNSTQVAEVKMAGTASELSAYETVNVIYDTGRKSASKSMLLPVSHSGYIKSLGHLVGIDISNTTNPTANKTVKFDLLSRKGCDFQFLEKASTPNEMDLSLSDYPKPFDIPFDDNGTFTDQEFDKSLFADVAFSGSYNDLTDKPDILSVNRDNEHLVFTIN